MATWTNEQKWANQPSGTWDGLTIGTETLTWDDSLDEWDGHSQTSWLNETKS